MMQSGSGGVNTMTPTTTYYYVVVQQPNNNANNVPHVQALQHQPVTPPSHSPSTATLLLLPEGVASSNPSWQTTQQGGGGNYHPNPTPVQQQNPNALQQSLAQALSTMSPAQLQAALAEVLGPAALAEILAQAGCAGAQGPPLQGSGSLPPPLVSAEVRPIKCYGCGEEGHKACHCPNNPNTVFAVCAVHGKLRTMRNLQRRAPQLTGGNVQFECVPSNPCRSKWELAQNGGGVPVGQFQP